MRNICKKFKLIHGILPNSGGNPQDGRQLLQDELNSLKIDTAGGELAWDDVSGMDLVPELVHKARAEEMQVCGDKGV